MNCVISCVHAEELWDFGKAGWWWNLNSCPALRLFIYPTSFPSLPPSVLPFSPNQLCKDIWSSLLLSVHLYVLFHWSDLQARCIPPHSLMCPSADTHSCRGSQQTQRLSTTANSRPTLTLSFFQNTNLIIFFLFLKKCT